MRRQSFHLVHLGGQPLYILANTALGISKQHGTTEGFYRITDRPSPGKKLSFAAIPFLFAAASILAGLVWFSGECAVSFFYLWSVMLTVSYAVFHLFFTGSVHKGWDETRLHVANERHMEPQKK